MTIKKRIIRISIILLAACVAAQFLTYAVLTNRVTASAQEIGEGLAATDQQIIEDDVASLSGVMDVFIQETECSIDNEMRNAALVLQKLDSASETGLGTKDLVQVAEETSMDEMYLTDMQGIFTVATVDGAVGTSLFDIWDGYSMLVKGEAEELPSNLTVMAETGDIYKFMTIPRYDATGKVQGIIESAMNASHVEKVLSDLIGKYEMIHSLHLFQGDGLTLASSERADAGLKATTATVHSDANIKAALDSKQPVFVDNGDGRVYYYTVVERDGSPAYVMVLEVDKAYYAQNTSYVTGELEGLTEDFVNSLGISIMIGYVCLIVTILLYFRLVKRGVLAPISKLQTASQQLANGDVNVELDTSRQDEIGELERDFALMAESIHVQANDLEKIAAGDYTADVEVRSDKDIINQAIADMLVSNNKLISEIRMAATQVDSGAQQVALGAQNLAAGATDQSIEVDRVTGTLGEVVQQTDENASFARQALDVNVESTTLMDKAMQTMDSMLVAMQEIDQSSQNISKIIKVIEDIAFQTNILALNAAVEAARAGESGKGFAVVADEVRNLASKSAEAAKETAELIEGSAGHVNEGNSLVDKTNADLMVVKERIQKSYELMQSITQASERQMSTIAELDSSMQHISEVVQTNSATSQESAAAAEEMSSQSAVLNQMVSSFKLKE